MGEIITANDSNFESFLHESKTVIVDFWAPTCAPCQLMEPGLEEIARSYPDSVRVLKINVNESPKVSSRYLIRSLPTLLFFKDGQVKMQIIGAVTSKQIARTLSEVV